MFDRKQIKAEGKMAFKNNYWRSVFCALILAAFAISYGGTTSSQTMQTQDGDMSPEAATAIGIGLIVCILIKIFVLNPLEIGCMGFFKENMSNGQKPDLSILKDGFKDYGRMFLTLLLRDVFLVLWTLLFIIPGIIKLYSYRMVPYIIRDNPDLPPTEAITLSRKMMDGNKWDVFVFDLSYIGWMFLGAITCGLVNVFWTMPYWQNANAGVYMKLKG